MRYAFLTDQEAVRKGDFLKNYLFGQSAYIFALLALVFAPVAYALDKPPPQSIGCAKWDKVAPVIDDQGKQLDESKKNNEPYKNNPNIQGVGGFLWRCVYGTARAKGTIVNEDKADPAFDSETIRVKAIQFLQYALSFLALIAVAFVLYGGVIWLTSSGNETLVTKARKILFAGLIGLIIITSAWVIISFAINTSKNVIT